MLLEELFKYQLMGKLVEFVITHDDLEFSQKEIFETWNRNQRSIKKELVKLTKIGLIRVSRRIAHSIQYRTNKECALYPVLKTLIVSLRKYEVK